jgi:nucleotide-binding universal stress UspA family protein
LAFDLDSATAAAVESLTVSKIVAPMPILVLHAGTQSVQLRAGMEATSERLKEAGFEVTTEVSSGEPGRVIPERAVADSSDLVIIGAFGNSRLRSLIFGSLTSEVIRACQTPVLLTRG